MVLLLFSMLDPVLIVPILHIRIILFIEGIRYTRNNKSLWFSFTEGRN